MFILHNCVETQPSLGISHNLGTSDTSTSFNDAIQGSFEENEQTDFIERTGQIEQTGSRKQIGSTSTEEKGSTKQFRSNISDEIIPPTVPAHTSEQSEENFTPAAIGEMFKKITFGQLEQFFSFHPKIPTEKVPFDVKRAYNRTTKTGATLPRHWLTF